MCLTRWRPRRARSHKSSFKSRTHFLKNAETVQLDAFKAGAIDVFAMGNIMPVVMLEAHSSIGVAQSGVDKMNIVISSLSLTQMLSAQ